ncbi:hypothetical protein [Paraburkholderia sediminicola]|uniref:hypothetical protein n=1 Tax=Paraburkholderia sediminicola TaxID=458836 RepID=UPI0038B9DF5B
MDDSSLEGDYASVNKKGPEKAADVLTDTNELDDAGYAYMNANMPDKVSEVSEDENKSVRQAVERYLKACHSETAANAGLVSKKCRTSGLDAHEFEYLNYGPAATYRVAGNCFVKAGLSRMAGAAFERSGRFYSKTEAEERASDEGKVYIANWWKEQSDEMYEQAGGQYERVGLYKEAGECFTKAGLIDKAGVVKAKAASSDNAAQTGPEKNYM